VLMRLYRMDNSLIANKAKERGHVRIKNYQFQQLKYIIRHQNNHGSQNVF
jgi:hypothetical protein